MHALYTIADLRNIERTALTQLPAGTLMQRAGHAAARTALSLLHPPFFDKAVLVLAGPGNNGGDALEAARLLSTAGCRVTVLLFADPSQLPGDARAAWERACDAGVQFGDTATLDVLEARWKLVVDGLFGIGLSRPLPEEIHPVVRAVNAMTCPVLALDVPSGLHADTGCPIGNVAIRASHTITFIGDKPGLHTGEGRDHAGIVSVDRIDIDATLFPNPRIGLNDPALFSRSLRSRRHNSHKGSYGTVAIVGGATGMSGAVVLAARAALLAGAGRVIAAFVDSPPAYDSIHPEIMCGNASTARYESAVVVAGPGLGQNRTAQDMLSIAMAQTAETAQPLVLDADALNLIASNARLQQQLARRPTGVILTPHPLEAARLLGVTVGDVQSDRLAAARRIVDRFNAVVVLKGSGTVIAAPQTALIINGTGNPGLASGGTGDVLAGLCGALLAQGGPPEEAARAAVWLHGAAADALVARGLGPVGLSASELLPEMRHLLNALVASSVQPK